MDSKKITDSFKRCGQKLGETILKLEKMNLSTTTGAMCFGKTNMQQPKHPLYLLKNTQLEKF